MRIVVSANDIENALHTISDKGINTGFFAPYVIESLQVTNELISSRETEVTFLYRMTFTQQNPKFACVNTCTVCYDDYYRIISVRGPSYDSIVSAIKKFWLENKAYSSILFLANILEHLSGDLEPRLPTDPPKVSVQEAKLLEVMKTLPSDTTSDMIYLLESASRLGYKSIDALAKTLRKKAQ